MMSLGEKLGVGAFFSIIAMLIAGIIGWVMNIFDIVAAINDPITAFFIARCVGVFFFPLGAILGYF